MPAFSCSPSFLPGLWPWRLAVSDRQYNQRPSPRKKSDLFDMHPSAGSRRYLVSRGKGPGVILSLPSLRPEPRQRPAHNLPSPESAEGRRMRIRLGRLPHLESQESQGRSIVCQKFRLLYDHIGSSTLFAMVCSSQPRCPLHPSVDQLQKSWCTDRLDRKLDLGVSKLTSSGLALRPVWSSTRL